MADTNQPHVRRSSRVLKATADEKDVNQINRQLRSLSIEAEDREKAKPEPTRIVKYVTQDSQLLSLPVEIRTDILKRALSGYSTNNPMDIGILHLPRMVLTCKQLFADVAPIAYEAVNFTFAVGTNIPTQEDLTTFTLAAQNNNRFSPSKSYRSDLLLVGTLGMRTRQRKEWLAGKLHVRLFHVTFKIYSTQGILAVRWQIAEMRRKGRSEPLLGRCRCEVRIMVDQERGVELSVGAEGGPWWTSAAEIPRDVGWMNIWSVAQAAFDDMRKGREDLKQGVTIDDVVRFAKAFRYDSLAAR